MSIPALPLEGGCRCGQLRFRITAPPLVTMACHCTGCQRMTASAFSVSALIPGGGFEVTQGEPVIGGLHGDAQHFFCGWCMSWMFTRAKELGELVNVRATLMDDTSWTAPFIETATDEKLPWASTAARHSYGGFPPEAAYPTLIQEFQALHAQG
jgi:hypothetical protein